MRTHALFAGFAAISLAPGCAAPQFKTYHLSARDWRGTELSGHGQLRVSDVVAGAAPRTNSIIEIGGLLDAPWNPDRRLRLQEDRARALTAALERRGVPPEAIGVEVEPATGSSSEPPPLLLAEPMAIVVRY
jgi:hypothetical protein